MDDKFSKLIMSLKSNINRKKADRAELLERKNQLSSLISEQADKTRDKEDELASLEEEFKLYNGYPFQIFLSIIYTLTSTVTEAVILVMYVLYNDVIITNIFNNLSSFLVGGFAFSLTTVLLFGVSKVFYRVCKEQIKTTQNAGKFRKKYKSKKSIEKKIEALKSQIQELVDQLNDYKKEESEIDNMLYEVSQNIDTLDGGLDSAINSFFNATLDIHDEHVEKKLNKRYAESGLDEQVLPITEKTIAKKLTYPSEDKK